jgi:hypothetical protein
VGGTSTTSPASGSYLTSARFSWLAVVVALVALALTACVYVRNGSVHWTAWALPVLITCNLAAIRIAPTRPRLVKARSVVGILIGLAIFVSPVEPMLRNYRR